MGLIIIQGLLEHAQMQNCFPRMHKVSHRHLLPFIHSVVSNDSFCGQQRSTSDYVDAKTELGLRYLHMPEGIFSHCATPVKITVVLKQNSIL